MPLCPLMFTRSAIFARHSSKALLNKFEAAQTIRRVASSAYIIHGQESDDDDPFQDRKELNDQEIFSDELEVVTWNIAAPNNNPFEYWATHESEEYIQLMSAVQECLDDPGDRDVEVCEVFNCKMYGQLRDELEFHGVHSHSLHFLDEYWTTNLCRRRFISGFLRDPSFGDKRLISMPDRITGSVRIAGGREVCR